MINASFTRCHTTVTAVADLVEKSKVNFVKVSETTKRYLNPLVVLRNGSIKSAINIGQGLSQLLRTLRNSAGLS